MSQKILILSQNDRHHRLETLGDMITEWLTDVKGVQTEVSHDQAMLHQMSDFDLCFVCFTASQLTDREERALDSSVRDGKPVFAIHSATVVNEKNEMYIDMIGGRFVKHSPYHEFQVQIEDKEHPITQGVVDFKITDELYILDRALQNAHLLASAVWEDKSQPMVYTRKHGKGNVLYNALGHDEAAFNNPMFQKLVVGGIKWLLQA